MNGRWRPWLAVASMVAVAVMAIGGFIAVRTYAGASDRRAGTAVVDDGTYDHDYTIGPGTAAAIRNGEDVQIVPRELLVHVGESIRIANHDTEDHLVGAFFVAAGETLTQRFTSEGVLEGACSIHPTGRFTIRVDA